MTLRDAWTTQIAPEDYESHMAGIGQAQANAQLVRDLLALTPIPAGARILMAGAGTGQIFDFIPSGIFSSYRLICSDISARLLARLHLRLNCQVVVDDVENSRLDPGFDAIILVLVLEHVDFRKAIASVSLLAPKRLIIVIQENPSTMNCAVTPGRELPGSMQVFKNEALPQLIPFSKLLEELASLGFGLERRLDAAVADGKTMIGALFQQRVI